MIHVSEISEYTIHNYNIIFLIFFKPYYGCHKFKMSFINMVVKTNNLLIIYVYYVLILLTNRVAVSELRACIQMLRPISSVKINI